MIKSALVVAFASCVTLATVLDPVMRDLRGQTNSSASVMAALLGEGRSLFANQFFAKADAYFHSGFYPTIFDKAKPDDDVNGEPGGGEQPAPHHEEEGETFLGKPKDWIERFGRNFFPTVHTHLDDQRAREILPWLRLSADMDPHHIQTYLTASYWLRTTLSQPDEAERFLWEGLKANPDSYEILLELGYVCDYNKKDARAARRYWDLALQKWKQQETAGLQPLPKARGEILDGLVRADRQLNDLKQMLVDLESLKAVSPNQQDIEKLIQETRAKLAAAPDGTPPKP